MKVLVACEYSGTVRDAFIRQGHDAISCDLLPTEAEGPHYQGDVLDIIRSGFDLMIAHPPCTYLCSSGLHWNKRTPGREEKTIEALAFVEKLWNAPIAKIAIENPIGRVSSLLGKATQIVQPYEFGHDASKATCLWLKGLPPIIPTQIIQPRLVCCGNVLDGEVEKYGCPNCNGGKKPLRRWGNQTNSGQNKLPPTEDRWKIRSQTYVGICIIPLGDSSEHYWRVCPCKPRFEREGDTVIEIHNAFDGRQSGTSAPKPN